MSKLALRSTARNYKSIAPRAAAAWLEGRPDAQLLDVREPVEFAGARIPGSRLLPLGRLAGALATIDPASPVLCVCRSGRRSAEAAATLLANGFSDVTCLEGGLLAWQDAGLAVERDIRPPWPLERQVRLVAGLLVLAGVGFSLRWPWAIGLSAFVGAGLTFAGLTDWCGMGLLLAKAPWNRRSSAVCGIRNQ